MPTYTDEADPNDEEIARSEDRELERGDRARQAVEDAAYELEMARRSLADRVSTEVYNAILTKLDGALLLEHLTSGPARDELRKLARGISNSARLVVLAPWGLK